MNTVSERNSVAISTHQARHLALAAQGFEAPRDQAVGRRRIMNLIRKLGLLQIDSVNVLSRAHYMPVFSRLGVYDRALLDQLCWGNRRQRRLFEYWGHEASMIPLEDYPLYRWRMDNARRGEGTWKGIARIARERPRFVADILRRITGDGALAASEISAARKTSGQWLCCAFHARG